MTANPTKTNGLDYRQRLANVTTLRTPISRFNGFVQRICSGNAIDKVLNLANPVTVSVYDIRRH
jgi:hypothetical protein